MRGPAPKDPAIRQRTNKASTRARLQIDANTRKRAPRLYERSAGEMWHRLTRLWWAAIWKSPMASEWLEADIKGRLYRLALMVDRYWWHPSAYLDAQICRNEAGLGLSPIDRRRLEWIVERAEEGKRQQRPMPVNPADDPRRYLEIVS